MQYMSPLEKVPFATFYTRWKYLCGTYFFKKRLFQVDSYFHVPKYNVKNNLHHFKFAIY